MNIIIVLNYNDYQTTKEFIKRVKKYKDVYKIIVVDNFSTDDSYEQLLKEKDEKVDVIKSEKNGGYAYGNNIGIKYAIKKYNPKFLTISNPDIIFTEDLIEKMQNACQKENVGQVAAIMKSLQGKKEYISWKQPTYIDCIIEISIILKKIFKKRTLYSNNQLEKDIVNVDVLSGAFFIIKAETMQNIGLFDERTFLYCEENILAYKLKEKGYKNLLLTKEEYIHDHGKTIRKNIKSILKLYEYLTEGMYLYITEYLKVGIMKRYTFKIISWLCKIEKKIYVIIKK